MSAIVEGDYNILIQMAKQLANGKSMEKVSSSWHLASRLDDLRVMVMTHSAFSFIHVRREANQVAYLLANVDVNDVRAIRRGRLEDLEAEEWIPKCQHLVAHDVGHIGQVAGGMREDQGRDRWQQGPSTSRAH